MVTIKKEFDKKTLRKIKRLYKRSFPKVERKPFKMILNKVKLGDMSIYSLFDDNIFVGEMIFIYYKNLVLLDYFAIEKTLQSKGYGSYAIELIKEEFSDKKIIIEIERPLDGDQTKLRRKNFYLKNGFKEQGYLINLFSVEMEVLTLNGDVSFNEYHQIFPNVFNDFIASHIKFIKDL